MKEQDKKFKAKRDKVRHLLKMTRIGVTRQTYMKLMGQIVNGKKEAALEDWEVKDTINALDQVSKSITDFRNELQS